MASLFMIGRRAYERRMREGERKFRKELRKKLRAAAKVGQRAIRQEISARGWSKPAEKTRLRVTVTRFRASATIRPGKKSRRYLGLHDQGLTVRRRGRRLKGGGRGRGSTVSYRKQETYRPGARKASPEVFRIIGRSLRVV